MTNEERLGRFIGMNIAFGILLAVSGGIGVSATTAEINSSVKPAFTVASIRNPASEQTAYGAVTGIGIIAAATGLGAAYARNRLQSTSP